VQKDGEKSERNRGSRLRLAQDLLRFELRHPESESDILTN
jgi:hypothetical protein